MTTTLGKYDTRSQRIWRECCMKERKLRLKWFLDNQDKLIESSKIVPENPTNKILEEEIKQNRVQEYRNATRAVPKKPDEPELEPDEVIQKEILDTMKPVDPNLKKMFYEANAQNRKLYLKLRAHDLPEDRYNFPETSNFIYGWKMFNHSKSQRDLRKYGHVQILRDSFYRRGGINRDPDNYREPFQYIHIVCAK